MEQGEGYTASAAASSSTLDGYVFRPVAAGYWRQHETWDGTYNFADLVDIHQLMDLQEEWRRRSTEDRQK